MENCWGKKVVVRCEVNQNQPKPKKKTCNNPKQFLLSYK